MHLVPVFLVQGHRGCLPLELQLGMGPPPGAPAPTRQHSLPRPQVRGGEASAPALGAP